MACGRVQQERQKIRMAELLAHGAHGDEDVEVVDERGELIEVVVVDDELLESLEIASFL